MREHPRTKTKQQGMTLVEVMVTIAVLSMVMASALTLYSRMFKNIQQRDSVVTMLYDSDHIMTYIGHDIRNADELLDAYPVEASQTLITAMKFATPTGEGQEEQVVAYTLDTNRPTHLVRSIYAGESVVSTTLSTLVQVINIKPKTKNLFEVELLLEDTVAGELKSWQASSAFALQQ